MEGGALSMRVQIPRVGCSFRHRFAALYGQSLAFAIRGRCWGCEGPPSGAVIASDPVTSSRFWAPRPKRSAGRHAAVYRVGCLGSGLNLPTTLWLRR